jgi:4-hydroxy-3-polyprenylbenzoate decarboxylase
MLMQERWNMSKTKRLVVGISGGSGAILAIRMLEVLRETEWETHVIITKTGEQVVEHETEYDFAELDDLATKIYPPDDFFAPFASGAYSTQGMVVVPCSMKTLAGIANGYSDNLLLRAADVCLKERRKLVLVTRETPLNLIHIENMRRVTLAGAMVLPPVLTMYTMPRSVDEMIEHLVSKLLDELGVDRKIVG